MLCSSLSLAAAGGKLLAGATSGDHNKAVNELDEVLDNNI